MDARKRMEEIIEENEQKRKKPTLLLHCCCAPCSSAVLEQLVPHFKITVFFYNPNIVNREEYDKRKEELKHFLKKANYQETVAYLDGDYEPDLFFTKTKGLEQEKEGGKRCYLCYEMRISKAVEVALEKKFDYVTTTLSISPYKHADWLNEIGMRLTENGQVKYLPADFKKRQGYLRSITLSKEYNLYRQDYCGCPYSKKEREEIKRLRDQKGE